MKKFLKKLLILSIVFFFLAEIICRLFFDPLYFYDINTYDEKKLRVTERFFKKNSTEQVDLLFIGSSRIPATINPVLLRNLSSKTVINAGRGYMTPGIHYQALKHKLKKYPNYLKGATVLIEYSGSGTYTSPFTEDELKVYDPILSTDRSMPHLLLPHLDFASLQKFIFKSKNALDVKIKLISQLSSFSRACQYIDEKFNTRNHPIFEKAGKINLAIEGGIRNDKIELARQKAIILNKVEKESILNSSIITLEQLDKSSFNMLYNLITNNGGKLMLYEMPFHSLKKNIYALDKSIANKKIYENWIAKKDIPIIYNNDFKYSDVDFPDIWHLSIERRDEFTSKLYEHLKSNL